MPGHGGKEREVLGVLADAIGAEQRFLLIEDTAENHIRKPNIVSAELQTDTHNSEATLDDLLKVSFGTYQTGSLLVKYG